MDPVGRFAQFARTLLPFVLPVLLANLHAAAAEDLAALPDAASVLDGPDDEKEADIDAVLEEVQTVATAPATVAAAQPSSTVASGSVRRVVPSRPRGRRPELPPFLYV